MTVLLLLLLLSRRGEPWGDFSMTINRAPRRIDTTGDFVDVSCGAFHNLALNAAGECFTWGINDFGEVLVWCACSPALALQHYCFGLAGMLGNGTTSYATCPEKVVGLEGVFIADVSAGGWHSMAISAEGGGCAACLEGRVRGVVLATRPERLVS